MSATRCLTSPVPAGVGLHLSRSALELQVDVLAPNHNYVMPPASIARSLDMTIANTDGRGNQLRAGLADALGMPVDLLLRTPTEILEAVVQLPVDDTTDPSDVQPVAPASAY